MAGGLASIGGTVIGVSDHCHFFRKVSWHMGLRIKVISMIITGIIVLVAVYADVSKQDAERTESERRR